MDGYTQQQAAGMDMGGEESASMMTAADSPMGEWQIESVTARPAENGGVIVTCNKRRDVVPGKKETAYEDRYQSKDYAFGDVQEALAYMAQELGAARGSAGGGAAVPPAGPAMPTGGGY